MEQTPSRAVIEYYKSLEPIPKDKNKPHNVDDMEISKFGLPYTGKLFLGAKMSDADMMHWVKHHQIKVVISMGFKTSVWVHLGYFDPRNLYIYDLEDLEEDEHVAAMRNVLPEIAAKMVHHLTKGENVMVHCHWGMSRSATAIMWFLTKLHKIPIMEAAKHIKERRMVVFPKYKFIELCV